MTSHYQCIVSYTHIRGQLYLRALGGVVLVCTYEEIYLSGADIKLELCVILRVGRGEGGKYANIICL